NECFEYGLWARAFEKFGMRLEELAQKEFSAGEILPWEHLGGPGKEYLRNHYEEAMRGTCDGL
ncbi:MAG TPA: hypothetical protein VLH60_01720, partial [Sedimentisphaerales bacterium]|nr:hypothetical protein [Sedimentisphaerales bacterium]